MGWIGTVIQILVKAGADTTQNLDDGLLMSQSAISPSLLSDGQGQKRFGVSPVEIDSTILGLHVMMPNVSLVIKGLQMHAFKFVHGKH